MVGFWCSGLLTLFIGTFGIGRLTKDRRLLVSFSEVGNFLSLVVLCQSSMKSVFNHLLGFLCVADLLFIIPSIVLSVLIILGIYKSNLYPVCECISHFGLASSIFITTAITFGRHQVKYLHIIKVNSSIPVLLGRVFSIFLPEKAC